MNKQYGQGASALEQSEAEGRYSVTLHGKRVAELAVRIGEKLGFDPGHLKDLAFASRVHDVGLIGAEQMLWDNSHFTEEDLNLLSQHPAKSVDIVAKLKSRNTGHFVDIDRVISYVLCHHEHFDGTGYPHGLSGEAITIGARIILVADAYDAMTNPRPYRKAFTHEHAIALLGMGRGKRFDPQIVDTFVSILSEDKQSEDKQKKPRRSLAAPV